MALISANDVINYTAFDSVKNRATYQLDFDIVQASQDIFKYCGHKFEDTAKYFPLPTEVKLAFIKLAEYYALINSDEGITKGIKSEKIGDYQYQVGDGKIQTVSLDSLLSEHVQSTGQSGFKFKMRSF